MNQLMFWNQWNKPYRQLYWFLLIVFLTALALWMSAWFIGRAQTISWTTNTNLEPTPVGIYEFSRNLFSFSVPVDVYSASDFFTPDLISYHAWHSYAYLLLFSIGMIYFLSVHSFMEMYGYMAGMLGLLGIFSLFHLDILLIAGRTDKMPLIVLFVVTGGLSYYFNSIGKSHTLLTRLLVFALYWTLAAIGIGSLSKVEHPFLYLAAYSSELPLYMAAWVVLWHGTYLQKLLFKLLEGNGVSGAPNSNLLHFFLVSLLYVISLVLLLLKKLYVLDLPLVYVHPFIVFLLCSVSGIWLFRKHSELFGSSLPFVPAGALLYLAISLMAVSGMMYACFTDNYGLIEAYERFLLYGYLGTGLVFTIYVIVNFGKQFGKQGSMYHFLYQPVRMTYWAIPAITITITTVFFIYQKKYPLHLAKAGYYTHIGDLHAYVGENTLALQYYQRALTFDYPNPRVNYAIASLSAALGDKANALGYYENGLYRNPSPEAFAGMANTYLDNGEYFKAVFTLQEGIQKFPSNGYLLNNLGMAYSKTNLLDSTIFYLRKSAEVLEDASIPHSNLLYVLNKRGYGDLADSLSRTYQHAHVSFEINRLSTALMHGRTEAFALQPDWLQGGKLQERPFAYVWNYAMQHPGDTLMPLEKWQADSSNQEFREGLQYLMAWRLHRNGNAMKAIEQLENLVAGGTSSLSYSRTLGYWMLEQDAYEKASLHFKQTYQALQFDDLFNLALAQLRVAPEEATETLKLLRVHPDSTKRPLAQAFLSMLESKPEAVPAMASGMQVYYAALHPRELSDDQVKNWILQLDPLAGATMWADRLEYLSMNEPARSIEWYKLQPQQLNEACYTAMAVFSFFQAQPDVMSTLLEKDWSKPRLKPLLRAWWLSKQGKEKEAADAYELAWQYGPLYYPFLREACKVLNNEGRKELVYQYLLDALKHFPDKVMLKELYVQQCLDLGYTNYAQTTLTELKGALPESSLKRYQMAIDSILYSGY
ncbi:MAG: hypothetical protein MUF42_09060 [Cytophagaceae bacterium]|jgi:tetratricopeptide (TPR) repeat protein|nr:hypothetical protein [Cytophagaceae bacterium]